MAETGLPETTGSSSNPVATGRRSALAALALSERPGADAASVSMAEAAHTAKLSLRGNPADRAFLAAVGKALDMVLPTDANTTTSGGGVTALWLGPNEWLLTAAPGLESDLAQRLREALQGVHAAVVDVTEASTVIRLSGPRARDVLAKGCPLDLHPRVFSEGRVAQSLVGPVDVILHQTAPDAYDLYVRRSFAPYLWQWLEDAALEFGPGADR